MQIRSRFTPILLCLAAVTASAQETTGSITGHVATKAGKPFAGAIVRITSTSMLGERTTLSDGSGQFRFPILPGGHYILTATAKDMVSSKTTFQVLAGQVSKADVVLTPTAELIKVQSATVEVVAAASQVDKTETVTQTNMAIDDINQLMSSNLEAITYLAPGIANAGGSPRIRGGSGNGTKWLLNGSMVNDQAWGYDLSDTTIQDMIESVAVVQSPLNARYGNTDSGIISMVTVKGTNSFAGSIRAKYYAGGMEATPVSYPDRMGNMSVPYPNADDPQRTYDITLRGPIWKDHITFAFGGTYSPLLPTTSRMDDLISDPAKTTDRAGTFFMLPNGTGLRRASTYQQNQLEPVITKTSYNQFDIYWQVNANHQIEWNYTQNDYRSTWYGYNPIDPNNGGMDGVTTRMYDLGYKGIIGSNGVLEARFGKTNRLWPHPTTPTAPISILYGQTITPNDQGAYLANSFYDIGAGKNIRKWTNGATSDRGDNFFDTSININYEHTLNVNQTTHLIDVGMESQKFQWDTQITGQQPPINFYVPGQLASDYTSADTGGIDPALVNGKYIVMNWQATYADAGGVGNKGLYDNGKRALIPYMVKYEGNPDGTYWQPTTSFYINDLWTLNKNHSVMVGLRRDAMKVQDNRGTIFGYSVVTPRFEYKWDIYGDQSRLVNVSYGQFHSRVPGGQFQQFVNSRLAYASTLYWSGTAPQGALNPTGNPNAPYLVDKAAITDQSNYTKLASFSGPGTYVIDPSWREPIATEYTVGMRRSYESGMFWRATMVYKTWKNLYDSFPEYHTTNIVSPSDPTVFKSVYRRIMSNDPLAAKTYKGFEVEWSIPFSAALKFAGNYTYARTMTSGSSINDSPSNDRKPYGNFRDFYSNMNGYAGGNSPGIPMSAYAPDKLQDPEHNVKTWFVYDLSTAKVKSSLTFMATYISGSPDYRTSTYDIGYPVVQGLPSNTGLRNYINLIDPGYTMDAVFSESLKYDAEVELGRGLRFFVSIQIKNPFNTMMNAWNPDTVGNYGNGMGHYTDNYEPWGNPTYLSHGWRAPSDVSYSGSAGVKNSPRSFTLEAGLKF